MRFLLFSSRLICSASGTRRPRARVGFASARVTRRHLISLAVLLAEFGEQSRNNKSQKVYIICSKPNVHVFQINAPSMRMQSSV